MAAKLGLTVEKKSCDVLIIGGGTAGCYAALTLGADPNIKVLIAEKANIKRSGCLAAGVNALNAYISKGHVPQDYVEYARKDAEGIVRDDLLLTMSENLNEVTHEMERRGLVILKDENGEYVTRGWRNIKINGENIKPILAEAALSQKNVEVINHVNITDLKLAASAEADSKEADSSAANGKKQVAGAYGFSVNDPIAYDISAKVVLIATGGAAGLYKPNNPGFSRHKMWYPPFNTGAGLAMGILAGAEMTTLENRFIALRCKDTIAPTGTIAQGVGAKQVNAKGEIYETKYGITTPERIWGTVEENRKGNGPCYLKTSGIGKEQEQDLYKAYLNMAPSQTLKWIEAGRGPAEDDVEIEGTEPYIVGGHTASGFWVDTDRATTIPGLYAAGDVAGGAPQKYVTGAMAEGKIAAQGMEQYLSNTSTPTEEKINNISGAGVIETYETFLNRKPQPVDWEQAEEAMQKIMDEYAGGIGTDYIYNEERLAQAKVKIADLRRLVDTIAAADMDDLMHIYEVKERLIVCESLIAHMEARKETRWHTFGENATYPDQKEEEATYVNSVRHEDGVIEIIRRPLVKEARYEHQH